MPTYVRYLFFVFFYLRQWNEVNIGGDYEIGHSVLVFVILCTQ